MSRHPEFYTALLRRSVSDGASLTICERLELQLHLRICPQCGWEHSELLAHPPDGGVPGAGLADRQQALARYCRHVPCTPFLCDLVEAQAKGRPLTGFLRGLWQVAREDKRLAGDYTALQLGLLKLKD